VESRHLVAEENIMLFALILEPGGIIAWIVVGIVAGFLAGLVMRGGGFGLIGDLICGLVGAFVGGFLLGFIVPGDVGFWGSIGVAFVGACVVIFIVRLLAPRRTV
jgi:uncharacterized membrane protein YeaQ/YmgE (transglycosylase-associated protein family)